MMMMRESKRVRHYPKALTSYHYDDDDDDYDDDDDMMTKY